MAGKPPMQMFFEPVTQSSSPRGERLPDKPKKHLCRARLMAGLPQPIITLLPQLKKMKNVLLTDPEIYWKWIPLHT